MTLVIRPGFAYDTDASNYIDAVEVADGLALETATRYAINNFVIGCKQDGIWAAIKASCILAGARTLAGALVPLVGAAPTNFNFESGDYNRKTGLKGNASTKYLDSNRSNTSDPLNSKHLSVYVTEADDSGLPYPGYIGTNRLTGQNDGSLIFRDSATNVHFAYVNAGTGANAVAVPRTGLLSAARNNSSTSISRWNGTTRSAMVATITPTVSTNLYVLATNLGGSAAVTGRPRIAFYSIGEFLDLALLDARVTALINAFGVAIP